MFFVFIFAISGEGYMVATHASSTAYTSTNQFSQFKYVLGTGTTAPLTHANITNLLLQFNKGITSYHTSDVAMYEYALPPNTVASSITMNVSYVDTGYDDVFLAVGSPSNKVWQVNTSSKAHNKNSKGNLYG
jgi:hypothetical protein